MYRRSLVIRAFFALCLLAATFNHARAIAAHGPLWDYGYGADAMLASKIFWASLTLFDPLAALLLFVRPRAGLALTVAIIVCDVLHNGYYVARHGQWLATFYVSQVAFCVAVLALTPLAATPFVSLARRSRCAYIRRSEITRNGAPGITQQNGAPIAPISSRNAGCPGGTKAIQRAESGAINPLFRPRRAIFCVARTGRYIGIQSVLRPAI
jgi:hypothetical protein